jgi:hypothetical protein
MERKIKKKKKLNLTEMQDKGCRTLVFISLSGIVLFVGHPFFLSDIFNLATYVAKLKIA